MTETKMNENLGDWETIFNERFKSIENAKFDNWILGVYADEGKDKSHFCCTACELEPVYFFNLDQGLHRVKHHFLGKPVKFCDYVFTDDKGRVRPLTVDLSKEIWELFVKDFDLIMTYAPKGTIIIDTATRLWEVLTKYETSKIVAQRTKKKVYPFDYKSSNEIWDHFLTDVRFSRHSMILTHKTTDEYIEDKKTGDRRARVQKETPFIVDAYIKLGMVTRDKIERFAYVLDKGGMNPANVGKSFIVPTVADVIKKIGEPEGTKSEGTTE